MARSGADILVETLIASGVDAVFGLPGDGINGEMKAIRTRPANAVWHTTGRLVCKRPVRIEDLL